MVFRLKCVQGLVYGNVMARFFCFGFGGKLRARKHLEIISSPKTRKDGVSSVVDPSICTHHSQNEEK